MDTVWLTPLYVLFFIEIGSRRVHLAGCTYSPTHAWVVQQARNLVWKLQDGELCARFLLRDRDAKFSAAFDEVFRSEGVEVVRLPYRSPRANSFAEGWVGTARREVLDHLLIFGRQHLERVMIEFIDHYHQARPHQGLGQRRPYARANEIRGPSVLWSAVIVSEACSTSTDGPPEEVAHTGLTAQVAMAWSAFSRSTNSNASTGSTRSLW